MGKLGQLPNLRARIAPCQGGSGVGRGVRDGYIEDEGIAYGAKLRGLGVKVEIKTYKGVPHPTLGMVGCWPLRERWWRMQRKRWGMRSKLLEWGWCE